MGVAPITSKRERQSLLHKIDTVSSRVYNLWLFESSNSEAMSVSYAVIEAGGMQFRVTKGEVIRVPSIQADIGSTVEFKPLALSDGEKIVVGHPLVDNALVRCTVIEHGRDRKVIVFKFKRRKQYRRKKGHRQDYTAIQIEDITLA